MLIRIVLLVLARFASAQVSPPAPRPASAPAPATRSALSAAATTRRSPPPASQPSEQELKQLHAQAVELMHANQYSKAKPLMEKVYASAPVTRLPRAFVINHAVMDLRLGATVRALRDILGYLSAQKSEDELGTNILGAALNLYATPRGKQSDLFRSALREWERRNALLEQAHSARRWGTEWVSEQQYNEIQARRQQLSETITKFADRARESAARARSLASEQDFYQQRAKQHVHNDKTDGPRGRCLLCGQQLQDQQTAEQIGRELTQASADHRQDLAGLQEAQSVSIKPDWPTRFEPIDAAADVPTTSAPPAPAALSAADAPPPPLGPLPAPAAAPAPAGITPPAPRGDGRPSLYPSRVPAPPAPPAPPAFPASQPSLP